MKWIPARVPGAVQLDIARAENYPTWYYAENWKNYPVDGRCVLHLPGIFQETGIENRGKIIFLF